MDSRGKQRLTGAVILVALFVLLVPELLTGPRNAGGDAPSEEGMRRYTIDLDAPAGGARPQAPAEPAPAVALPPVAEAAPRTDGAPDARAVQGEPARVESPPASAPSAATPTPAPPPAHTTPAAVTATPTATPRAPVATNPAPPATVTAAPRGGFAVQLGSFVSKENAERLVREMNAKGFNAFLAPPITTGGRELWRVRVGPTRDRPAAEALATQLRRIGQQGSIVPIS